MKQSRNNDRKRINDSKDRGVFFHDFCGYIYTRDPVQTLVCLVLAASVSLDSYGSCLVSPEGLVLLVPSIPSGF